DRLHHHLTGTPDLDLTDLAYSLATTRTHHPYRATITAPHNSTNPRAELLDALHALHAGHPHPGLTHHHHLAHPPNKIVFVLPGQGAQYPTMGAGLYASHPGFARTLDEVCTAMDPHLPVPLREVLFAATDSPNAALIHQTR